MSIPCYVLRNAAAGNGPSPSPDYVPCGVTNSTHLHVNCCRKGDYCMSHALCHYTFSSGQNGYYAAACTDPKMQDPVCLTRCGGQFADVTYVATAGLWACCIYHSDSQGSLVVDCNNHSQEIFPAPAPSDLVTLQYIPTTGTPTYGAAIATTTSIASSSSGSSESSGSNIGGGAAAGIGVGVAAAIILIAMAIAFLFFRRGVYTRSRAPRPESGSSTAPIMPHTGSYSAWVESATNLRQSEP